MDGCTARDLRAAAHAGHLARQLTGLAHPPPAPTPARSLPSGDFSLCRKKRIHTGIDNSRAGPTWDQHRIPSHRRTKSLRKQYSAPRIHNGIYTHWPIPHGISARWLRRTTRGALMPVPRGTSTGVRLIPERRVFARKTPRRGFIMTPDPRGTITGARCPFLLSPEIEEFPDRGIRAGVGPVRDGYEAGELPRQVDGVPRGAQVTGRAIVHRRSAISRSPGTPCHEY